MQIQKPKQGYKIIHTKYSGFYEIPDDWSLKKLGEILQLEYGEGLVEEKRTNSGYPVYGSGGPIGNHNEFLTTGPGIVVSRKGSLGNVFFISDNFWAIDTVYYITKDQTKQDLHFLTYFLKNLHLENYAIVTAQPGISREEVYAIHVKVPSLVEQQKIASILSNIDSLIQQTQKTIEQSQRLKKGLMQRLFTKGIGHTKFKKVKWYSNKEIWIPESWEMTTIGDEFALASGGTPRTINKVFYEGNIHWITSSDLNRGIVNRSTALITEEAVKRTNLKIYPKGSFIIAAIGVDAAQTRGNCGILGLDAAINQVCIGFKESKRVLTQFFFYFYLQYGNNLIFTFHQGTKQWALYPYVLRKISFPLPPIQEQEKIGSILSNVDLRIQKQQEQNSNLENLKKGLMQKLLTGQIRVKV